MKLPVFSSLVGLPLAQVEARVEQAGRTLLIGEDNGEIILLGPPQPGQVIVAVENEIVVRVLYPKPGHRD